MQDEPGGATCFSYKMSLEEGGDRMLGIEHQHERRRANKSGTNPGILEGTIEMKFEMDDQREVYGWVGRTLRRQRYGELKRSGRGLVRRYLAKVTGLSRAQVARLIRCYQQGRAVERRAYKRHRFTRLYTRIDIELLAETDEGPRDTQRSGDAEDPPAGVS